MIRGVIFDLDGTLVQTERIKALCYHKAIVQLGRADVSLTQVEETYKQVVGQTRHVVSRYIMGQFGLEPLCRPLLGRYGVTEPEGVLTAMRLLIYDDYVSDDAVLRANVWPFTMDLLQSAKGAGCRIALATSSLTAEAHRVLKALQVEALFDAVVGLDQVEHGKPNPEIYLTTAANLDIPPGECLVIEDSAPGVTAGLAAGMNVIGVATPFTLLSLHETALLAHRWLVHDPAMLADAVRLRIAEHNLTHESEI